MLVPVLGMDILDFFNRYFSAFARDGENLMAGSFDRSRFMDIDVSAFDGNNRLIWFQRMGDCGFVAICAADQKMDVGVIVIDFSMNEVSCPLGMLIKSVADVLFVGKLID